MSNQRLKLKEKAREPDPVETIIHKLQPICGSDSTILVLPKKHLQKLKGFKKGDYVKVSIYNGDSLLIQKMD